MPQQSKIEPPKKDNLKVKSKNDKLPDSTPGNDFFRDTVVRLFGYSHIIGQNFESIVCRTNFTQVCTGVSLVYCAFDVFDKYSKALNEENRKLKQTCNKAVPPILVDKPNPYKPYIAAGNAVVWQSLASFIIPIIAVNRLTYFTRRMLKKMCASGKLKFYLPPIIGIASLPLMWVPVDSGVTQLLDIAQTQPLKIVNDNYRDTYIRLLGYAFVISKTAYRGLHKRRSLVDICYGISLFYCFGDAIDKCDKLYAKNREPITPDKKIDLKKSTKKIEVDYKYETIVTAVDVFLWQSLASFIIPGYILSGIRLVTRKSLKRVNVGRITRNVFPAILALSTVPFIIIPIDRIVDELLQRTYRQIFK